MSVDVENRSDTGPTLRIVVNGEETSTGAVTLFDLICERGLAEARVATARNGDFVAERARVQTRLQAGDRVEILSARHGG